MFNRSVNHEESTDLEVSEILMKRYILCDVYGNAFNTIFLRTSLIRLLYTLGTLGI